MKYFCSKCFRITELTNGKESAIGHVFTLSTRLWLWHEDVHHNKESRELPIVTNYPEKNINSN